MCRHLHGLLAQRHRDRGRPRLLEGSAQTAHLARLPRAHLRARHQGRRARRSPAPGDLHVHAALFARRRFCIEVGGARQARHDVHLRQPDRRHHPAKPSRVTPPSSTTTNASNTCGPASFPMTRRYEVDSWDQDWEEVEGGENDLRRESRPVPVGAQSSFWPPGANIDKLIDPSPFFRVHSAPRQVVPGEESGQSLCRPDDSPLSSPGTMSSP